MLAINKDLKHSLAFRNISSHLCKTSAFVATQITQFPERNTFKICKDHIVQL